MKCVESQTPWNRVLLAKLRVATWVSVWNLKKHYPVHNTMPQDLILRQTNPDRILISLTSANTLGYSTIYASSF